MDRFESNHTSPKIHQQYEATTGTWQYIIADSRTRHAVIIDPVLDFNPTDAAICTTAADSLLSLVERHEYVVDRILETHASTERSTAAWYIRTQLHDRTGHAPRICMGKSVAGVQRMFIRQFGPESMGWEQTFDTNFEDGETFPLGNLLFTVLRLPGRSIDHVGYLVGDALICGDAVFNQDYRVDDEHLPRLGQSIQKILTLPPECRIYTGQGNFRASRIGKRRLGEQYFTTVATVWSEDEHVAGMNEAEFVAARRGQRRSMVGGRSKYRRFISFRRKKVSTSATRRGIDDGSTRGSEQPREAGGLDAQIV